MMVEEKEKSATCLDVLTYLLRERVKAPSKFKASSTNVRSFQMALRQYCISYNTQFLL